jgi:hypothetical protein
MAQKWRLKIENLSLGGYAPAYWQSDYPSYGNKNHAGRMKSVDLTNPTAITQGPGLSVIDTASVTMKGIHPTVIKADTTYGFGGTKLYSITESAVTNIRTIADADGESVALYDGDLFYIYDTDIGKFNLSSTYDDDWGTDVAGFSALTSGEPHPSVVAGTSGVMYIANGQYVAEWNGTTATDDAFDTTDSDSQIVDIRWNQNRLWIAANKPSVSGRKEGSVYLWDGNASSWLSQVKVLGEIGTLYVKNGITYIFYQKSSVSTLGYVDGSQIVDLASWDGDLPEFYQVTDYEDFIIWASGTLVFAFGAGDVNLKGRIFQLSECGAGGLANPFGDPITSFSDGVKQFSGYETDSNWKSILYDITGAGKEAHIDTIRFNIEPMASGARCDWSLVNNSGDTIASDTISYASQGTRTHIKKNIGAKAENFRLEFDWQNGNTVNNVAIKNIDIQGHSLK